MKIGIYEKAINSKFSWSEKIKIAKDSGFDFIELSIDETDEKLSRLDWTEKEIEEIKNYLKFNNIYFNSMCLSGHRKYPFGSQDINIRKKALEIMIKAINLAKKLNIRIIQLAGYDVYYEPSSDITKKYFIEGLLKANSYAQENSIMLAFEVMDTAFMGTIERAINYVKEVNSPWLMVYPDVGNLWQYSKDPITEIIKYSNFIVAYHLKETKPNIFRDLNFGEGNVNFKLIFEAIKKTNFNGPFLLEMWSTNSKNETMEENIKKLKTAKKFIIEKMKLAGWKNV